MSTNIVINKKRLLSSFLELVQIDSPSGQEQEVGVYLKKQLTDLGGRVQQDDAGNLIAWFPGQGEKGEGIETEGLEQFRPSHATRSVDK